MQVAERDMTQGANTNSPGGHKIETWICHFTYHRLISISL